MIKSSFSILFFFKVELNLWIRQKRLRHIFVKFFDSLRKIQNFHIFLFLYSFFLVKIDAYWQGMREILMNFCYIFIRFRLIFRLVPSYQFIQENSYDLLLFYFSQRTDFELSRLRFRHDDTSNTIPWKGRGNGFLDYFVKHITEFLPFPEVRSHTELYEIRRQQIIQEPRSASAAFPDLYTGRIRIHSLCCRFLRQH